MIVVRVEPLHEHEEDLARHAQALAYGYHPGDGLQLRSHRRDWKSGSQRGCCCQRLVDQIGIRDRTLLYVNVGAFIDRAVVSLQYSIEGLLSAWPTSRG